MTNSWYLYVNKETLQVCRVSPSLEEADDCHLVQITQELGISFIDQPHTLNDYVVYHDGTVTHFVKKEKTNDVLVPFFYSPVMITESIENPDVLVTIHNEQLTITLRPELTAYAMTLYASAPNPTAVFFVSAKNDPNQLIDALYVDMMKLISNGKEVFNFAYDPRLVSIFTRKVFDTYGLKITP